MCVRFSKCNPNKGLELGLFNIMIPAVRHLQTCPSTTSEPIECGWSVAHMYLPVLRLCVTFHRGSLSSEPNFTHVLHRVRIINHYVRIDPSATAKVRLSPCIHFVKPRLLPRNRKNYFTNLSAVNTNGQYSNTNASQHDMLHRATVLPL
jgi:hypothetical protein